MNKHDDDLFTSSRQVSKKDPNYDTLRHYFRWMCKNTMKLTSVNTTQYTRFSTETTHERVFFKPSNLDMILYKRIELAAWDIVYADVSANDDGSGSTVIFVGVTTLITDFLCIKTTKQFVNTLEDHIIARIAPH